MQESAGHELLHHEADEELSQESRHAISMSTVAKIAKAVTSENDLSRLAETIADELLELGGKAVHVYYVDQETGQFQLSAHRNIPPSVIARIRDASLLSPLAAARAASEKKIVHVIRRNVPDELYLAGVVMDGSGGKSILSIPLIAFGNVLGVLSWICDKEGPPKDGERQAILSIAEIFALAIQNALNFQTQKETKELFERILADAPIGMAIVDREGTIMNGNAALAELLGYDQAELPGLNVRDITHPDDLATDLALAEQLLRSEIPRYKIEKRYLRKSGEVVYGRLHLSRIVDPRHPYVIAQVEDITEAKRHEQARDEWVSIVAHDLKQPLTTMALRADLLAEKCHTGTCDVSSEFRHLQAGIRQARRITDDLLDLTLLDARRMRLRKKRIDLASLTKRIWERAQDLRQKRKISFKSPIGQPLWTFADPGRIEQVLMNFLTNAVKFSAPDSTVHVDVEERDGEITTSVSNQGSALSPDETKRIFDRFSQGRLGAVHNGSGLGLYISKSLIEAHGGRIGAESNDGSTRFWFALPRI